MKIVIPGGSGQVGTLLARAFHDQGHNVVILSRTPSPAPWQTMFWDGTTLDDWATALDGADALINLAGATVNCRYTPGNRSEIMRSRIASTRILAQACRQTNTPPKTWLQASTATIYSHTFDTANDEANGVLGGAEPNAPEKWRFSIDVATAWEHAFNEADLPDTRQVVLRSALILSPDHGGIFDTLLRLVRWGLGGQHGSGRQFVSWVHYEDFIETITWLLRHKSVSGTVNIAAPNPIPNREFMEALRAAWGARLGLPAYEWMLEAGALFLRTETELILKSRKVSPARLQKEGFAFRYPTWGLAAPNLCAQWRAHNSHHSAQPA